MNNIIYETASNNIFADIGVPDPEQYLAKADLARKIISTIKNRELKQIQVAGLLGISQPRVSDLLRGRLAGFSMERLLRFLALLGNEVSVVVKKCCTDSANAGKVRVFSDASCVDPWGELRGEPLDLSAFPSGTYGNSEGGLLNAIFCSNSNMANWLRIAPFLIQTTRVEAFEKD